MTTPAIQTHHLRKEFNGKVAVADLSLEVARGEVFGFLGPNGAGKTTSVKMLLGLINPTVRPRRSAWLHHWEMNRPAPVSGSCPNISASTIG